MKLKQTGILALFLLLCMILFLSLSACGRNTEEEEANNKAANVEEAVNKSANKVADMPEESTTDVQEAKEPEVQEPKKATGPAKEIGREEHFIAYDDGTVLDTKTNLMWASKSSETMNWDNAKTYIANFKGSGYTDWRMPTKSELESLMDPWLRSPKGFRLTKYIDIQACCPWSSEKKKRDPKDQYRTVFDFANGLPYYATKINHTKSPALPVRGAKK
ncbi:MAG: DUF1566 domain-containing protein [Desulfobacteraceae bacterium]|nr:DUF1566 domain-containing protein [Desulfobacteraceae bacterium]